MEEKSKKLVFADSENSDEFSDSSKDKTFADLHIHSRFSRACSKNITIENLVKYAKIKGLNLLGTGDFTHPLWLKEIKGKEEKWIT
jgi:PHP family Zn ribbon phosphoesterase